MKKLIALLLAMLMVLSLAACGNKGEKTKFTDDLADAKKILVGISPDYPPYEYYAEDGSIQGFDMDAFTEIVAILNKQQGTNIEVTFQAMTFSTIVSAVQTGQVDVGVSCFTYDPERDVLFSNYYLKSAQVIAVAKDSDIKTIADCANKNIGAGTGTTGEKAAMENIDGCKVTSPGDYVKMFEYLKYGQLDAVACDEAVGQSYAATGEFKVLEEKLVDEEVSVIVAKENTLLMDALNKAIDEFVKSGAYTTLKAKHGLAD